MKAPEVSVVIPTRNRWVALRTALRSALGQARVRTEIIVVDDGSDEAPPDLPELADPGVSVLEHAHSRGVSAARNTGLSVVNSEWVGFLDDDDVWAPTKLRRSLDAVDASQTSYCYSAAILVDDRLRPLEQHAAPGPSDLWKALLQSNAIPGGGSNMLIEASALARVGAFDETLAFGEDWDLWLRLCERSRGAAVPEALVAYRQHRGGWAAREDERMRTDFARIAERYEPAARGNGVAVDEIGHRRFRAYSLHLAGERMKAASRYLSIFRDTRDGRDLQRCAGALAGRQLLAKAWPAQRPPAMPDWLAPYARSVSHT